MLTTKTSKNTKSTVFMLCGPGGLGGSFFTAAFLLIGFTAVIAQVVLMRELIVVFHGNELSLGLVLACWFLWTALGSGLVGRMDVRRPHILMAVLQGLISLAFPLGILAARFSRVTLGSLPGEILGPGAMLLVSLAALGLFCAASGGLFAAGSRLHAARTAGTTSTAASSLYLLEAVGSGAGGLVASLILIRFLSPFETAALLAALNLVSAASLTFESRTGKVAAALLALASVSLLTPGIGRLESWSLRTLWRGFDLLETHNSIYGNLAVVATAGSRSLFENGLVMATAPDPPAAEEAVHYALLQHPEPRTLLLIGGGENGSLAEALRSPGISRIDYVELDPAIPRLARRHFPEEWRAAEADPRVHVHYVDGRLFVKGAPLSYDVILVNLPAPQTAQLNRFYTVEFFREAARKLSDRGVLSFQLAGSENYIGPELAEFLRCIDRTLREVFRDVVVLPGDPVHFFASLQDGTLVKGPELLVARLRSRQLRTTYVREYYIPFRMSADRMLDLESSIRPEPGTPVNRDFSPIAYYFEIAYWSARFAPNQRLWFQSLARIDFPVVVASVGIATLLLAGFAGSFGPAARRRRANAGLCIAVMGFTLIALEMMILLGFQALYGYVYHGLSLLIAAFMAGIAAGSWLSLRRGSRTAASSARGVEMREFALLQAAAGLSPILMTGLFALLAGIRGNFGVALASQAGFPVIAFACGFLGGFQFPRAGRIFYSGLDRPSANIGALYALDLAGSCLGAVILSVYLIPVFGFFRTALLLGLLNCGPAVLAWRSSHTAESP